MKNERSSNTSVWSKLPWLNRISDTLRSSEMRGIFAGMAVLASGTGLARVIGFLSIPILTRLYSPTDFGVLAVYVAVVTIVAPTLTLRYALAIPLPRNNRLAINVLALSAAISFVIFIIISLLLWVIGESVLRWMSIEVLIPWRWLISIGGLASATYETLTLWAVRNRSYGTIAKSEVSQASLGELIKVGLGVLALKPLGLLTGQLAGQSAGSGILLFRFRSEIHNLSRYISVKRMLHIISTYRGFPIFRLPSQFLLAFSTQAPAMFATALYGVTTTGQLSLALMALAVPANLIGKSVAQAFYGEIARLGKGAEEQVSRMAKSVQIRLFAVGIPVTLAILLLGRPAFSLIFGAKWADAGLYASILAPFVLLQLTSAPLMQIMNIYGAQGKFLIINMLRTASLVGVFFCCKYFSLSEVYFVILLGVMLFAFYLFVTWFIISLIKLEANNAKVGRK